MAPPSPFTGPIADTLQALSWTFQTALEQDCRKFLGKPMSLAKPVADLVTAEGFFEAYPEAFAFVEGGIEGPLPGSLFLAIELKMAVTMSSLLLMTPPNQIEMKRRSLDLSEADLDAIEEIGNVLCGALGRVLQKRVGKEWHLKKRSVHVASRTLPPGEYLIVTWPLHVESYDGSWHLLMPLAFGEAMAQELLKARGEEPPVEAPAQPPVSPDDRGRGRIAVLEGNEADGRFLCQLLEGEGLAVTLFAKPGELIQPTTAGLKVQAIIFEVDSQPGWGVTSCRKLATDERTREIPVIAASRAPTAEMVVALVRAGARGFLVKPYTRETLLEKLTALGIEKP